MKYRRIGFIEAMKEELDSLLSRFSSSQVRVENRGFIDFHVISHGNLELIACLCGVGKVNAGIATALLIAHYDPDAIINVGVAGGFSSDQGIMDIFVAESFVYTDVDVTNLGLAPGQLLNEPARFPASADLVGVVRALDRAHRIGAAVHYGLLGSADAFIRTRAQAERIRELFGGAVGCVEMEGAAIAHACHKFGKPLLSIRSLSDIAASDEDNTCDFTEFLERASEVSTNLCMSILSDLSIAN